MHIDPEQKELERLLKRPFLNSQIEWRPQGKPVKTKQGVWRTCILAYVDARAVQERLDSVFGPLGWQNQIEPTDRGILYGIGVLCADEWIWKWDGSPETKIEEFKGGISKALVRVASAGFGIGRYLYDLPVTWVDIHTDLDWQERKGMRYYSSDQIKGFYKPPQLPESFQAPEEKTSKKEPPKEDDRVKDLHEHMKLCEWKPSDLIKYCDSKYNAPPRDVAKSENYKELKKTMKELTYTAAMARLDIDGKESPEPSEFDLAPPG